VPGRSPCDPFASMLWNRRLGTTGHGEMGKTMSGPRADHRRSRQTGAVTSEASLMPRLSGCRPWPGSCRLLPGEPFRNLTSEAECGIAVRSTESLQATKVLVGIIGLRGNSGDVVEFPGISSPSKWWRDAEGRWIVPTVLSCCEQSEICLSTTQEFEAIGCKPVVMPRGEV
jgi:hypothetical protein